uniref:Uncharacterized protein n=1 Tax=uncultured Armatimonadetes bacterium TaxID=157466 RepID=A0A6J4I760_9BACT|nr:hypothetical protein AVDCRST_MAG63-1597 [uncultured Armatimonadetes bacterium]
MNTTLVAPMISATETLPGKEGREASPPGLSHFGPLSL